MAVGECAAARPPTQCRCVHSSRRRRVRQPAVVPPALADFFPSAPARAWAHAHRSGINAPRGWAWTGQSTVRLQRQRAVI